MLYTLLGVAQRAVFELIYANVTAEAGIGLWLGAFLHGLPLDLSIAGYLSAIPALLIIAATAGAGRWETWAERIYFGFIALALGAVGVADLVLYSFWGTRLDYTPVFYFTTSPAAAMASATAWQLVGGIAAWLAVSFGIYILFAKAVVPMRIASRHKVRDCAVMLVVTACLFIPIRGSFTVATINLSQAYFCNTQAVNHAAVNPAFSLFYSAAHQKDFDSQFRFMTDAEAEDVHRRLFAPVPSDTVCCDTVASPLIAEDRPDIYIVLLESFSRALFPTLGGENVAVGLDSIARDGLYFGNAYASGFRTDRAIPAVVSGFPAQPTVSVMKYVDTAANLPALPRSLARLGYESAYYYGGDAAFTNMKAYLVNSGFTSIVSDKDFPLKDRMSKWGAPDHLVFSRAIEDIENRSGDTPLFAVIQTSSSHEPFDVPYHNPRFADSERLNAFAYVDSCATEFTNRIMSGERGDNSLIIFVADHWGVWPDGTDGLGRFHIPLIMTGGALARRGCIDGIASQTDIAATILAALDLPHDEYGFSRNLLDPSRRCFALFAGGGSYGYVSETDTIIYNCNSQTPVLSGGANPAEAEHTVKGSLQYLYHVISKL